MDDIEQVGDIVWRQGRAFGFQVASHCGCGWKISARDEAAILLCWAGMKAPETSEQITIDSSDLAVRFALTQEIAWVTSNSGSIITWGGGRPVGDYLRQVISWRGQAVALLVWGPASYALKDRDVWIS